MNSSPAETTKVEFKKKKRKIPLRTRKVNSSDESDNEGNNGDSIR